MRVKKLLISRVHKKKKIRFKASEFIIVRSSNGAILTEQVHHKSYLFVAITSFCVNYLTVNFEINISAQKANAGLV